MKEKKIGVSKIVIQMGDKEATLTVEQVKELRDVLDNLLGEKVIERVIERDKWWYVEPYIYPRYWTVTSTNTSTPSDTVTYGNTAGCYTIQLNGDQSTRGLTASA